MIPSLNKKGEGEAIETAILDGPIGLILTIIVFVFIAYVFFLIAGLFSDSDYDSARANAQHIGFVTSQLISSNKQYTYAIEAFFVSQDTIFVGHDGPVSYNHKTLCTDEIVKNKYCDGQACLCLYEDTNGDDFEDDDNILWGIWGAENEPVMECYTYQNNVRFLAPSDFKKDSYFAGNDRGAGPSHYPAYTQYRDAIIYGDGCDEENFDSTRLYIEKFYDERNNINYIYFDRYEGERIAMLDTRIEYMEQTFNTQEFCTLRIDATDTRPIRSYDASTADTTQATKGACDAVGTVCLAYLSENQQNVCNSLNNVQ